MYRLGTAWGILLEEKEDEEFACPDKQFPPSSFSDNGDEVRFHLELHMENGERKKKGRASGTAPVTKIDPYIRYYILTPLTPFHPRLTPIR